MCQYFSVRSRTGKYEYLRFVSEVQKTISLCMSLISCQEGVQFPSKENSTLFLCHRCMKGSLLRNGRVRWIFNTYGNFGSILKKAKGMWAAARR